jgi:hypothetical protein
LGEIGAKKILLFFSFFKQREVFIEEKTTEHQYKMQTNIICEKKKVTLEPQWTNHIQNVLTLEE